MSTLYLDLLIVTMFPYLSCFFLVEDRAFRWKTNAHTSSKVMELFPFLQHVLVSNLRV
jgi:hypothetical protein